MKVLVICQKIPYPLTNGASLIVYNIFKRLAARHEVYLVSFLNRPEERDNLKYLKDIFAEIHVIEMETSKRSFFLYLKNIFLWNTGFLMKEQQPEMYGSLKNKINEIVTSKKIGIVHTVSLFMAEFAVDIKDCTKILHIIDSSTLALERRMSSIDTLNWKLKLKELIWYKRIKNYEKKVLNEFELTITVGKKDLEVLKSLSPDANIALVPNGVDTDYFHILPKRYSEYPVLVFFGNMTFQPNVDAALYFYYDIFPLIKNKVPDVQCYIVGTSPPESMQEMSNDSSIIVTGYVDDVRTYIGKADVVICPMKVGGGIKNKILEAMSLGRAVVSTSIGAEGINVTGGENIIIADTPAEFAESVVKLLNDIPLRARIINNARELINEQYTWDECAMKYEQLSEGLMK